MIYEIIPSPGTANKDFGELEQKIQLVTPFVKTIHIDVIDGKFAPNVTFLDPEPFKPYTTTLFFEVHLMVENPIEYVKPFAAAGFKRFLGQIEKMPDQGAFIKAVKDEGAEVCLAVDGPTSLDTVTVPYEDMDGILCMTITAGFSGQSFVPEHLEKVKMIRHKNPDLAIEVDGGINDKSIIYAKQAGANRFITTSYLFGAANPEETYKNLEEIVNKY